VRQPDWSGRLLVEVSSLAVPLLTLRVELNSQVPLLRQSLSADPNLML
jgi:hypothetical protein